MNNQNNSRGIWEWDLVKLVVVGSIVLFGLIYGWGGFTEESTRLCIRWSARISVTMFCLAFGASAIHHFTKNSFSFWLLMNRKYWGISFALIHLIHLFFLGILQFAFHPVFTLAATTSLTAGGIAYLFLTLMLFTSFDFFAKKISRKNWKRLHTVGGYWIWGLYANSNWGNVLIGEKYHYLPIAIILVIVLFLRIAKWWSTKKSHVLNN